MEMTKNDATKKGGYKRIAFSPEDDNREPFKSWCLGEGLILQFDEYGNMFAHAMR